ncbi:DUF86 domain-containing protein [Gracilibacillus sp. S3-1-1]|uniref:DUF86 domain-containing protein n=1 Tax=Gracilibacillus pellucidus TaxID=3095368 RepID=A0ACC6M1C4_9BACI|nr:DUF86 domain-containing protein [Gracilibacillus sp. S3-1-1]MDX8044740.1 DUF86 domain-containing protein [Gracilibacillus sp. S3-1-1]
MYFVDMRKMNEILDYFDQTLALVKDSQFQTPIEHFALERISHVLIESMIDIGNMMIDGFIMRDPGSYVDIIHILVDEKVIPAEENDGYEAVINMRKMLVQNFRQIDHDHVSKVIEENMPILARFSSNIRAYLASEMGVANTFTATADK